MNKICAKCGKAYDAKGYKKYCSDNCSAKVIAENYHLRKKMISQHLTKLSKKEKKCKECGVIFVTNTSVKKYCTTKCAAIAQNKKYNERNLALAHARKEHRQSRATTKRCTECGSSFTTLGGRSSFCSSDCYRTYYEELKVAKITEWESYL